MSSLGEVQRIIGLSLNKIQMGRNQRGGLPLHKNLLVATVLNKARDVYMQETMYMNYRLMACGQFAGAAHHATDLEDEDTPEVEDYEEDSESDVEDEIDPTSTTPASVTKKEYISQALSSCAAAAAANQASAAGSTAVVNSSCELDQQPQQLSQSHNQQQSTSFLSALSASCGVVAAAVHHQQQQLQLQQQEKAAAAEQQLQASSAANNSNNNISDEGFIDESDCDCDRRNFCQDSSENSRVPFQYCYTCAPFHPSNGRGPTLVSPGQSLTSGCVIPTQPTNPIVSAVKHLTAAEQPEDKLIYDMDSKSTKNSSPGMPTKRKRHISSEETQEAISSILPKKLKASEEVESTEMEEKEDKDDLNDSGFQEDNKYFHPAFRGPHHNPNGMEVEQITSLVSIFSFGQQLFNSGCIDRSLTAYSTASTPSSPPSEPVDSSAAGDGKHGAAATAGTTTTGEDEESGDESDSDTSSDSGHSSDDQNNVDDLTTTNLDTAVANDNSVELPALVAPVLVASSGNNNIANLVATTKTSCVAEVAAESGKTGSIALVADDASSSIVPGASLSSGGGVVVPTAALATVV